MTETVVGAASVPEPSADSYLARAIREGYAEMVREGRGVRILYVPTGHREIWTDPEEQVRAEFWAELIYRYGYDANRIGIEIRVPDRTPHDAADLVVFRDDEKKRPYAVVECKRDGITDAEFAQAIEQAAGNGTWSKLRADFVGVVAGATRRFLDFSDEYGALEREANIIADLPLRYGRPEEFKFRKGTTLDIAPVDKEHLIAAIRKSHQTLWGGGRLSPPAAFGELCKVIFVKISDEKAARRVGEPYAFQIKTHEPASALADRIRDLYLEQQARDPEVFTENIKISDGALRTIVSHLEGIDLSGTDLDTKGLAFEQFMDGFFKGDFGQYFTPREIIDFTVQMLEPQESDLVLDPACGSGGFLLHALDKVRSGAELYYHQGSAEHFRHWHAFAQRNLFGIEINDEIARVAKMNMILHDDGHSNIVCADALEPIERLREQNKGLDRERFDLVLTNPPFGANVLANERPYLATFDLGHTDSDRSRAKLRKGQKTEVLFLERVWDFLKPGTGRAGVVVPDGVLTNGSLQYVRDFIFDRFQVLAVVSLPQTAFSHYGAGVKASVIFLRRYARHEKPDETAEVFMATPRHIGYDAQGRATGNDLVEVVGAYREFSKHR
jgi:type I restriction enzyme M protein